MSPLDNYGTLSDVNLPQLSPQGGSERVNLTKAVRVH